MAGNSDCRLDGFPANTASGLRSPVITSLNKINSILSNAFHVMFGRNILHQHKERPWLPTRALARLPVQRTAAPAGALSLGSTRRQAPRVHLQTLSLCGAYERLENYAASFVLGIILIAPTSTTLFYLPSLPWFLPLLQSGCQPLDQQLSLYAAQHKTIPVCNRNLKERC